MKQKPHFKHLFLSMLLVTTFMLVRVNTLSAQSSYYITGEIDGVTMELNYSGYHTDFLTNGENKYFAVLTKNTSTFPIQEVKEGNNIYLRANIKGIVHELSWTDQKKDGYGRYFATWTTTLGEMPLLKIYKNDGTISFLAKINGKEHELNWATKVINGKDDVYKRKAVIWNPSLNKFRFKFVSTNSPTTKTGSSIKILTYNVYMINPPLGISAAPNRSKRAKLIGEADFVKGYDVVILNELFDNDASKILMDALLKEYPYQTKVIGRSKDGWDETQGEYRPSDRLEGGVAVLSKYPFEEKIQFLFPRPLLCGMDALSNKGFAYVKIIYQGEPVHIVATHLQAADALCPGEEEGYEKGAAFRLLEFSMIKDFVAAQKISPDAQVFIGGDMNVIEGTPEYDRMLTALNVYEPEYTGHHATYDPKSNYLIEDETLRSEMLDYIFVAKGYKPIAPWYNHVEIPEGVYADHYPVIGGTTSLGEPAVSPYSYFKIEFKTGSKKDVIGLENAGTDANMHITLVGTDGESSEIYINGLVKGKNAFEANQTDIIEVETKTLGRLQQIKIRKANGDDWYPVAINITNVKTGKKVSWSGGQFIEGGSTTFDLK